MKKKGWERRTPGTHTHRAPRSLTCFFFFFSLFLSLQKLHATRLPTAPLIALWAACVTLVATSTPAVAAVRAAFAAGWTAATAPVGVPTPGWLPAFAAAFAHPAVSAAAWAHLLAIDLVQARWILVDGAAGGVPTRHSVALTLMAGPLGLVSHALTRAAWAWRAGEGSEGPG